MRKILSFLFLISIFFVGQSALASETVGTIDIADKYAWGENIGWINFGCDGCDVEITDAGLTGHAWSRQYGWINLNPDTAGVVNDGEGTLSGFAWSSNLGWIDFTGVTVNSSGEFLGYAEVDLDDSRINFNCATGDSCASADFKVATDWRPESSRESGNGGTGGGSYRPPGNPPFIPPFIPPIINFPPPFNPVPLPNSPIVPGLANVWNNVSDFLSGLPGFTAPEKPVLVEIPVVPPPALAGGWNLVPEKNINSFVFAPLPYEIRMLASKFPELGNTLQEVGVDRLSDVSKLAGVNLRAPGLADILDKTIQTVGLENLEDIEKLNGVTLNIPGLMDVDGNLPRDIGTGKIALIEGLPIAQFTPTAKKNLPTEFVFARGADELVDLGVGLSVGNRGEVSQKISSLPGQELRLVVKPISSARSVTGYFIFQQATPKISRSIMLRSALTASALFSMNGLVEEVDDVPIEKKLVMSSFEYTDADGDGIYTADVITPVVAGEYEIITVIEYTDPTLGTRRMSMVTVIDPEGYVFEKNNGKETRIPSAVVSIYKLNFSTKEYVLWDAKAYSQENPQITDVSGTYSFLVPEGTYYLRAEAPGYEPYEGKAFGVSEGNGVHQNIELDSGGGLLADIDPQTALLVVVCLLLMYNLYRNSLRDKLLKFSKKYDGKQ